MKGKLKGHHGDLGSSNKLYEYNIIYEYNNRTYCDIVKVNNYIQALIKFQNKCNFPNYILIDIIKS